MTPTEREDYEIAKEAYTLWRGSHHHNFMPADWNDLGDGWKESYCKVVAHARRNAEDRTNG